MKKEVKSLRAKGKMSQRPLHEGHADGLPIRNTTGVKLRHGKGKTDDGDDQ